MDRMRLARIGWDVQVALTLVLLLVVAWRTAALLSERVAGLYEPPIAPVPLTVGAWLLVSGLREWLLAPEVWRMNWEEANRAEREGRRRRNVKDRSALARSGKISVAIGLLGLAAALF